VGASRSGEHVLPEVVKKGRPRPTRRRLLDGAAAPLSDRPVQAYEAREWAVKHRAEHGWDGALLAVGHNAGGALATGACRTVRERGTFTPLLQITDCSPLDLVTDPAAEPARTRRPPISPWSARPGSPPTSLYCCPPWSSRRGRRLRRDTGRIRSPRGPPHGRRTARDRPLRPRPDGRTTPHSPHRQAV